MSYKSRNSVVKNAKPQKRKKSCCCSCLTTILVVVLIIIVGGGAAGWYFGNQYTQANFDMKLGEVLGVVRDVTSAKEKKIVTNSYANTSDVAFENKLKSQLFLKSDVPIDKAKIMDMILPKKAVSEQSDERNNHTTNAYLNTILGTDDNSSGGDSNAMLDLVSELLTKENMDFSALKAYTEEKHADYILSINDKELAKFLSDCIAVLSENEEFINGLDLDFDVSKMDLKEVIRVDQLIFTGTADAPKIKVTLSVGLRSAAKVIINELIKEQVPQLESINVGNILGVIVPKRIYATAELDLGQDDPKLNLFINNMDQGKMDRFYKLIKGVGEVSGGELDIKKMIDEALGDTLKNVGTILNDYADFSDIAQGNIKIDLFDVVLKIAKINEGENGEIKPDPLTSQDLVLSLKYLLASDPDFTNSEKTPYSWMNQYEVSGSAETVYSTTPIEGGKLVDYQDELLNEMSKKLLIDISGEDGIKGTADDLTFSDLMELLGLGGNGGGTSDLMGLVNGEALKELAKSDEDSRVIITDRMLGAMFNSQISTLMSGDSGTLSDMELTLYYVSITVKTENGINKQFLEAAIGIDTSVLFGSMGEFADMLKGILPESLMVSFKMEMTVGVDADSYEFAPTTLLLNDLKQAEVDRLLSVIEKLVPDFGFEGITSQLEAPLREALNTMNDLVPVTFQTSKIIMADVFTLAVDLMINNGDQPVTYEDANGDEVKFSGADLKEILNELFKDIIIDDSKGASESQEAFLTEVVSKYFLKDIEVGQEEGQVDTFDEFKDEFNMADFSASQLDAKGLMTSSLTNEELRPLISEGEIAGMIKDKMAADENESFGQFANIQSFDIIVENNGDKRIELAIEVSTDSLFGENGGDYEKFFSFDALYVFVKINLDKIIKIEDGEDDVYGYETTLAINEMDELQLRKVFALIGSFNKDSSGLDLEKSASQIGHYMYKSIGEFEKNLGGNIEFTDKGIKIASIFDLIVESQKTNITAEEAREALQGLYEANAEGETSEFNYAKTDIFVNEIETDTTFETVEGKQRKADIAKSIIGINNLDLNLLDSEFGWLLVGDLGDELDGAGIPRLTLNQGNGGAEFTLTSYNIYAQNNSNPALDRKYIMDSEFAIKDYNKDTTYMEFVFEVANLAPSGSDNEYSNLMPEKMYITILFMLDEPTQKFVVAETLDGDNYLRINKMSKTAQNTLFDIASIDLDGINGQLDNCADVFNNDFFTGREYSTVQENQKLFGSMFFPASTYPMP